MNRAMELVAFATGLVMLLDVDGQESRPVTIRVALQRWCRFLWLGLMVVGVLAGGWRPQTWLSYYLRMACLAFLVFTVIGVFAYGFACPRCRRSLVMKGATIVAGDACVCPKCGVSKE